MNTILIIRNKSEMNIILKRFNIAESDLVITFDDELYKSLQNTKFNLKKSSFYQDKDINIKSVDWLNSWSVKKLYKNKNIKELLSFENFSAWWMMNFWLSESQFYYNNLTDTMSYLNLVIGIIKKENPKEIVLIDNSDILSKVIKLVCNMKSIKTKTIKNIKKFKTTYIKVKGIKYYLTLRAFLRYVIFSLLFFRRKFPNVDVLASGSSAWTYGWNHVLKRNEKLDIRLYPLLDILRKKGNSCLIIDRTSEYQVDLSNFRRLLEKRFIKSRFDIVALEKYLSLGIITATLRNLKKMRSTVKSLKKQKSFVNSFEYMGVNFWPIIKKQFLCYFDVRLFGHILNYFLIKKILKKEQPKVVFHKSEGAVYAYTLFSLCRKLDIPVVSLQHGAFREGIHLIYNKSDMTYDLKTNKTFINKFPLPNILCVWGKSAKNFLVNKGNYPESIIRVTSETRYDNLYYIKKSTKRDKILKELNLNPNKKTILYATGQPYFSYQHWETVLRLIIESAKKIPNSQLIIKLHHGESLREYKMFINKYNPPRNTLIIRDYNTFKLIVASDVLINVASLISIESMFFGKNVIIANLSGKEDPYPFVEKGAAFGVRSPEEMIPIIKKCLSKSPDALKKIDKGFKFAEDYFGAIDGKASERVANEILPFIEKSN